MTDDLPTMGFANTYRAYVVGIDLSLTCTGLAMIDQDGSVSTRSVKSIGKVTDTLAVRATRIKRLAAEILTDLWSDSDGPCLEVIIESPAHTQGAASGTWDRAGLWWAVVSELATRGVATHHVAPTTTKKWITGSGRAEKNTLGVHIGRLFPDAQIKTDDEADALAMAHIAAVRAGFPVPKRAGHTPEGWKAVKWASGDCAADSELRFPGAQGGPQRNGPLGVMESGSDPLPATQGRAQAKKVNPRRSA